MKIVYWLLCAVGLVLVGYSWFGITPPVIGSVSGAELEEWYRGLMIVSGLLGVGWGTLWAFRATKSPWKILHRPGESGDQFNRRVTSNGIWGMLAAAIVGVFAVVIGAVTADFVPLVLLERILALLFAAKALGLLGSAVVGASVAYAAATRMQVWGGQEALIPISIK